MPFMISMLASFFLAELAVRFTSIPLASEITGMVDASIWKNLFVFVLVTITITLLLKFMPNAKVKWVPALIGGLVAALLLLLWLWACARLQGVVTRNSKLYGSFAIVPIVLFWVFVSWQIVLFAAEVAFATQNCSTYRMEYGSKHANVRSRLLLALSVVLETGKAMLGKADYFELSEYARTNKIPVRFLNDMVDELVKLGFLAPVSDRDGRYVLLKPPADISVRNVIDQIIGSGVKPEALGLLKVNPQIERIVKTTSEGMGGSLSEKTIADLVNG
jgi:membrane protein